MKRILLVNKFYYQRGGDCLVMINTERLLHEAGYEVAIFAMDYEKNIASQHPSYFASEVSFSGKGIAKAAMRSLGMGDIVTSFRQALDSFKPHVVHFHNIHSYLSPVIVEMAHDYGCRVLWTTHDYKLICPAYNCLRNEKPCELCFNDKSQVLRTRCMKGSLAASALAYVEALKWNRTRLQKSVDYIISPSQFMADKMIQSGFNPDKIAVICNCIEKKKSETLQQAVRKPDASPYYCYIGRLSTEKGIENLLKVADSLPYKLHVAGGGPLEEKLRKQYAHNSNIVFTGHLTSQEVIELISNAKASVIPSICYENNPLSVIESLCAGTPVIGARIGGIPELIEPNSDGLLFDSDDLDEMKRCISAAFELMEFNNNEIARKAIERFSETAYLQKLSSFF